MPFKLTMLSQQEARKILENANLPGTLDKNLKHSLLTKAERMKIIRTGEHKDDRAIAAVIEIQRRLRGHQTRCKLFEIIHPKTSAMSTEWGTRNLISSDRMSDVRTLTPQVPNTTPRPQDLQCVRTNYQRYCQRTNDKPMEFMVFCACVIQRWWRRQLEKSKPLRHGYPSAPPPTTNGVASIISSPTSDQPSEESPEAEFSGESRAASSESKSLDRQEAAKSIQRAWRKHIDIQVYTYYRELINFKNRGDPALMLRCINPREADLLDSAAGVHIKFRLAGEKFPPNIYYKIFTHRNVADIGAFAPRDYTLADNKRLPAIIVHNKGTKINTGKISSYKRWENNGWRLVSDRMVQKMDQDPVIFESTQKIATFHHNKFVRRQDVEKRRKQKKIEWMKKMYKQGMLQTKGAPDHETQSIIQTVAQGMVNAVDTHGNEAVEDWEVDELLEWTNGLNFDKYLGDWKEFATSAGSEFLTQLNYIPDDPFSFNMSHTEHAEPCK